MTTHNSHRPDDDHDRPPVDPFRPDRLRCDCGATAGRDGQCRKCRARARWARRTAGHAPHADRPPSRRRERRSPAERDRRTGR